MLKATVGRVNEGCRQSEDEGQGEKKGESGRKEGEEKRREEKEGRMTGSGRREECYRSKLIKRQ